MHTTVAKYIESTRNSTIQYNTFCHCIENSFGPEQTNINTNVKNRLNGTIEKEHRPK